jgi:hypothetical protein
MPGQAARRRFSRLGWKKPKQEKYVLVPKGTVKKQFKLVNGKKK